jgi:hypothetical protein
MLNNRILKKSKEEILYSYFIYISLPTLLIKFSFSILVNSLEIDGLGIDKKLARKVTDGI